MKRFFFSTRSAGSPWKWAMGIALAGFAITSAGLVGAQAKATVWPANELMWKDSPGIKGAQQATLWGDPATGGYGALKKVTNGTVLPMHWHTHATRFVIVAGTIAFTLEGGAPKNLPPQSYATIPGDVKHAATCVGGGDCVYFETSNAAYDIKIAGAGSSR